LSRRKFTATDAHLPILPYQNIVSENNLVLFPPPVNLRVFIT